jgi:hypothetical protein
MALDIIPFSLENNLEVLLLPSEYKVQILM